MINDSLDKIYHFKGKENGRKKYSKRCVFRTWNKSSRTSENVRCTPFNCKQLGNRENTENGTNGTRTHDRKQTSKRTFTKDKRSSKLNKQNLINSIFGINQSFLILNLDKTIDIIPLLVYNTINNPKNSIKGTKMEKITLDFSKTVNDEDIEMELESKLKGLVFLLDTLVITGNSGEHKFQKDGFYALQSLASSILDDVNDLKINVEYMYQLLHKFKDNDIVEVA